MKGYRTPYNTGPNYDHFLLSHCQPPLFESEMSSTELIITYDNYVTQTKTTLFFSLKQSFINPLLTCLRGRTISCGPASPMSSYLYALALALEKQYKIHKGD